MRTLYLFRHGQPELPEGGHRCCGSVYDPPVCRESLEEAAAAHPLLRAAGVRCIAASPLRRCRETAAALSGGVIPVRVLPALAELDSGEWDGLSFAEIRLRWPELYARRGEDPSLPPPGGETYAHGAARGLAALGRFLAETEGNAAAVAHAGLNRAMLCALTGTAFRDNRSIPQDYLCGNLLRYDGGVLVPERMGVTPPELFAK